jgi:CRP-like cAMP-binding protein
MSVRKIIAETVLWETLKRWQKTSPELDRIEFLKTVPFFNDLSNWQLKKVSEIVFERSYDSGELIFEQGQPGAALFLIVEGQVSVEIYKDHFTATLAVLEKGAFFGEMALLDEAARSASARSLVPTKAIALYRNDLTRLIETDPDTACHIYHALARITGDRLRRTNELVQNASPDEKVAA